jgi:hypothetical protein
VTEFQVIKRPAAPQRFRDGFVTALNARAAACGGEIGIPAIELVARLAAARVKEQKA